MKTQRTVGIVRVTAAVAIGLTLLLVLAGCGSAKQVAVVQADSGSSVSIAENGTLEVSLLGNASTGYSWNVVDDAGGILDQLGDPIVTPVEPGAAGQAVGMTQRQTFQFDAAKKGSGELKMEYKRAWETTVPPETTFTLDVTVE